MIAPTTNPNSKFTGSSIVVSLPKRISIVTKINTVTWIMNVKYKLSRALFFHLKRVGTLYTKLTKLTISWIKLLVIVYHKSMIEGGLYRSFPHIGE